jgi:hypothetical protein
MTYDNWLNLWNYKVELIQCSDPRDRIYSLLSMTNGDLSNLQVNYNISRVELAAQVLTRSGNSLCLCTALLVAQILGLRHQESSDRENHLRSQLCLEFCVVDHLPKRHFVKPSEKLVLCGESRYPKLYFYETCTSSSFIGFKIPWDLLAAPIEHLTLWDKERSAHWKYIGVARISLCLFATIVNLPAQVDSVRGDLPVDYPRICYAADPLNQPGMDKSSLYLSDRKEVSEAEQFEGLSIHRRTSQQFKGLVASLY